MLCKRHLKAFAGVLARMEKDSALVEKTRDHCTVCADERGVEI